MTTSDTPETDDQPIIYALNELCYQVPCVDLEFARKLERERDEARKALEFRRELYKVQEQYLETARRERDEAQERECAAIESWWEEHQRALREGQRVVEAREQNAKLRDIADRAIIPLECDGVPWGAKLRAELEHLKEVAK